MFRFVLAACKEMLSSSCEDRRDIVWSRLPTAQLKTFEVSSLSSVSSAQHYLLRVMLQTLYWLRWPYADNREGLLREDNDDNFAKENGEDLMLMLQDKSHFYIRKINFCDIIERCCFN